MTNTPKSSYRPNPDRWHWELRNWFLYYMVREQRFVDAIASLGRYWERVLESGPDFDPMTPYYALPFGRGPRHLDPHDPLNQYLVMLQACVADELRCRVRGKPATWVCHAVHASFNGTAVDLGMAPQEWLWLGELQIPVLSTGAAFVVRKINGFPFSDQDEVERQTIESPHLGTPFNQWENLKRLAQHELDRLLEELKDQVESKTADWPNMYRKGRTTRTNKTMQKLVSWIVGREEQFAGDRSATNALLQELRLDPPGKSKKSG